jgi:Recombination endonuclease VII
MNRFHQRRTPGGLVMTAEVATEIRTRSASGETRAAIAADLGISQRTVGNIVAYKCWADEPKTQEYVQAKGRRDYARNRERYREQRQAAAAVDPDFWRKRHFQRRYGLTLAALERMLAEQGGTCAACGDPITLGKTTHVDHCHRQGYVRGLLCSRCNQALGLLKEDRERIRALLRYLDET